MNPLRWKKAAAPFAPAGDATETIWQDPSSYNPYMQGPPYLPGLPYQPGAKTASVEEAVQSPEMSFAATLTMLRALAMIHQSHHWLTYGPHFYADHLLFERLYNGIVEEIDKVAERAVGLGVDTSVMHPTVQAKQVARIVEAACGDGVTFGEGENANSYVGTSLKAERWFLGAVDQIATALKAINHPLTRGSDNLLQGIEDKHEEHVYLLNQRSKTASTRWKA